MGNSRRVELLAPAGNAEGFYGAVCAGADAVYLGGSRFGARAYAENFTANELLACIRYGHLLGRKIYLTVNTLVKEQELSELYGYLLPFYEEGLDGVIVQDMGVLRFVREYFPDMELHASTQMTLCNAYGARLLKSMGSCRIVPARELSLEELQSIKKETDIELETFVHGAMCYCYSGQCLFSSILGGRSGNRGRCAQPCRLPYSVTGDGIREDAARQKNYPLSLKDMCTIEHLPALLEAGIDSFKIEGRMKKPEYTAGVTAVYRKYIDRYYQLREDFGVEAARSRYRVEPADLEALSELYIRSEIHSGYYYQRSGREMVTFSDPSYSGSNEELLAEIRENYLTDRLRLPVRVTASFQTGEPALLTLSANGVCVSVTGEPVCAAQKQPITGENVKKQLNRLGDTSFAAQSIEAVVSSDAFYPLRGINELRREAVDSLMQKLLPKKRHVSVTPGKESAEMPAVSGRRKCNGEQSPHGYAISVTSLSQLKTIAEWQAASDRKVRRIYVDADLAVYRAEETLPLCEELSKSALLFLALPYILRREETAYLGHLSALAGEGVFAGFLVRSVDELGFLRESGLTGLLRADAGLYVWNKAAAEQLTDFGITGGFCIPYELTAGEQHRLLEAAEAAFEKVVYGRIPMMLTANCVRKTAGACRKGKAEGALLTDRYRKRFPVVTNCRHCMNIIYNSVPLSLWRERGKWLSAADLRLDFTLETAAEMRGVLEAFLLNRAMPAGEYTSGHEHRGAE